MFAAPPAEEGGKRMNDSCVCVHNNTMCVTLSGDAAETKKKLVLKTRVEKKDTNTHTHTRTRVGQIYHGKVLAMFFKIGAHDLHLQRQA